MDKFTKDRAMEMMRFPLVGSGQHPMHIPFVYVVGDKLFFIRHAAEDWNREVAKKKTIEVVSILEAYGVSSKDALPKDVRVYWDISKKSNENENENEEEL